MQALVSIILTCYNREDLIAETIDSIIAQTYSNWECIVVDDGSSDKTAEVVKSYSDKDKRIQFHSKPAGMPKGANASRNYGYKLSKGEFINWFDDDDLMHPQKLQKQVTALENPDYEFAVCRTMVFEGSPENILGLRSEKLTSGNPLDGYLRWEYTWLTQAPFWRKSFLEKMDRLFDEELQASQEWEFHIRVLSRNPKFHTTDETLVFYRKHQDKISVNEQSEKKVRNYFLSRHKIYTGLNKALSEKQKDYLRSFMLQRFRESLVHGYSELSRKIYKNFIRKESTLSFSTKLRYLLATYTFRYLGRGIILIKEIPY